MRTPSPLNLTAIPVSVEFVFVTPAPWDRSCYRFNDKQSGGPALDVHIHDTDMVLYLFGLPRSVRSTATKEKDGIIFMISTQFYYENRIVTASGGWLESDSFAFNMRAFYVLDRAVIDLDFSKDPVVTVYPDGSERYAPELPLGDGYYYELKDFIAGIESGKPSDIVSPDSAANSVRICFEEIRSAQENREITL